jgi:aspartokinase
MVHRRIVRIQAVAPAEVYRRSKINYQTGARLSDSTQSRLDSKANLIAGRDRIRYRLRRPLNWEHPGTHIRSEDPMTRLALLLASALVGFGASPALAQLEQGRLTGIVTDAQGAILPGVTVTATSPALIGNQSR